MQEGIAEVKYDGHVILSDNIEKILPLHKGDILLTQEVIPVRIGVLNKKILRSGVLYRVPNDLKKAIHKVLHYQAEITTIFQVCSGAPLEGEKGTYDLNEKVLLSSSFSMPWLVKEISAESGRFSLEAIGQNRDARTKDWKGYHRLYAKESLPPLEEYLTVKSVDLSFFEKKAVYKFTDEEKEQI